MNLGTKKRLLEIAKRYGYIHINLTDSSDKVKRVVRIANNESLSLVLKYLGIDHEIVQTNKLVDKQIAGDIPDYEMSIVVGQRHANYHNKGFQLGLKGVDLPNQENLIRTVEFLIRDK